VRANRRKNSFRDSLMRATVTIDFYHTGRRLPRIYALKLDFDSVLPGR
jgi:hypothetical protein